MFLTRRILSSSFNKYHIFTRTYKVAVIGGASDVGQTISLMLKTQPNVSKLIIHDTMEHTPGIALDVSHIPTEALVKCYFGNAILNTAFDNIDLVIIAGGATKTPGLPSSSLLSANIDYIKTVCSKLTRGPMPFVGIVTEPINTIVPIAAEVMKSQGNLNFNPRKLFGITGMDMLRAQCVYAAEHRLNPTECFVPIVGGHSEKTMIPLLSKATPPREMSYEEVNDCTSKILQSVSDVVYAKRGYGPSLSIAYSALLFAQEILAALDGQPARVHAYVENNDFGTSYFAGVVEVGKEGAGEMQMYADLSSYEVQLLESSIKELRKDVMEGRKILEMA